MNKDENEYKGFTVEQLDPYEIRPPNMPTDMDKFDKILNSMEEEGWQGRPLVVIDEGENYYGLTGSHRVEAAQQAGLDEVPVIKVPASQLDDYELNGIVGGGGSEDYVLDGLRFADLDKYAELVEEDLI